MGTRAKISGYAKGFVRGNESSTPTGAPDIAVQLNYAATNAADIITTNISASVFGDQGLDTGNLTFGNNAVRVQFLPGTEGGLYGVKGIDITTGIKSEA